MDMDLPILVAAGLSLLVLIGLWIVVRRRKAGKDASQLSPRDRATRPRAPATATPRARTTTAAAAPVTDFGPTAPVGRGGIEVDEMTEVVDLEALLSSVPPRVAAQTRDVLDAPTNIYSGPAAAPAVNAAAPLSGPVTVPTLPPSPPMRASASKAATPRPTLPDLLAGASLRDLALAWYEARGYRSSAVSPALAPVTCVLRHREDPRRVYAVIESPRQTLEGALIDEWLVRARAVGVSRVLVLTEADIDPQADARKGARVLNRARLEAELGRLDPRIAARIIGAVRARASRQTQIAAAG
jgi:LPXTG-motif cell wall-anchored protein